MACVECERRRKLLRDAIMHGRMAEALDVTVEGLRVMIGIDAGADHRKEAPVLTPALPTLAGKTKAELLDIAKAEEVVTEDGATNAEIIDAIETKRRAA
jgi:hypothetical protein